MWWPVQITDETSKKNRDKNHNVICFDFFCFVFGFVGFF